MPAAPGLSAAASSSAFPPAPCSSSSAVSAVVAHARSTPMHDAYNSCSDTAMKSLRVQRCRKVRQSCTVGSRSVEQTVDMSPAPAAGTYRRSAGTVHAQRQVPWECLAECSGVCPGPGPDAGGRSSRGGGVSGLAAACLEIPCSLVMPPGRDQFAPQSLGWARVCGTERSGIWVLKGDARTYNLPRNLDDVGSSGNLGQDMRRPGPRQGTSVHVHTDMDVDQFCHKLIPLFLQRRFPCGAGSHPF